MSVKYEDDPMDISDSNENGTDTDGEGDFNIDRLSRKVWLVKVPKFLAEKWQTVDEDGVPLGTVKIVTGPTKEPKISLHLPQDDVHQDIPKEYNLKFTNTDVKNTMVFTENGNGVGVGIEGTIHHECSVTPVVNDEYRQIMRSRQEAAIKPKQTTQVIDDRDVARTTGLRDDNTGISFERSMLKTKKPTVEPRKQRMDKQELVDALFGQFHKNQYFMFQDLVERTKQPPGYLREVLQDIAIRHNNGPHALHWELKPEYRGQSETDGSPT